METVIEIAREAGMNVVDDQYSLLPFLERFAELVRADERETLLQNSVQAHEVEAFRDVVPCAVIRARSTHET